MAAETIPESQAFSQSTGDDFGTSNGRRLLSIEPLGVQDLPWHEEFHDRSKQRLPLVLFLDCLLTEANELDIDHGWTSRGMWQPEGSRVKITMPATSPSPDSSSASVAVNVEQRTKGKGRKVWLARRSHHHVLEVGFSELEGLLAQDHARQEADYTPSVYDANELLVWNSEELSQAVAQLKPSWGVQSVQMSVYQMFHTMPSALGGLVKLQDRVFHVLVVTVHSTYSVEIEGSSELHPQALTFQLPVDIQSLSAIPTTVKRSHTDTNFKRYQFQDSPTPDKSPNSLQKGRNGNSLLEGFYVSLERLRKAPHGTSLDIKDIYGMHQWDMMTMSDARGITKIASQKTIMKGTLDAVTKDVYYVLDHIRHLRQSVQDQGRNDEAGVSNDQSSGGQEKSTPLPDKAKQLMGQKESEDIQFTRVRS